ncbi:MAG: RibD family protein [Cyanobacteria bacterium]|nr:RibD family protein [Cyanobacteriota bacterium]
MKVIACFASSLDGKIGFPPLPEDASENPPNNIPGYTRISSDNDINHLKKVRDQADAILMGGKTFRAYPKIHLGTNPKKLLPHGILTYGFSPTHSIPPTSPIFTGSPGSKIPATHIFTYSSPPEEIAALYPQQVTWHCLKEGPPSQTLPEILKIFEAQGVKTLLVEGGGEILDLCLRAQCLDELYLTLCPLFIGGAQAPGLLGGVGFSDLASAPKTQILSQETMGNEVYFHLKLK